MDTSRKSKTSSRPQTTSVDWKYTSDARRRALEDLYRMVQEIWCCIFWATPAFGLFAFRVLGDVVFLDIPFQPTLVIGSAKAAFDLMEKRSHLYSDRVPCRMDELHVYIVYRIDTF